MKKILTIAGSDSSGGAGIQADLKTFAAHGDYGMSVITAITAQNTTGVSQVLNLPDNLVEAQLDSVFTDIRPDAIKIGMVSDLNIIKSIVKKLDEYEAENIVLDPVMVATSGAKLMEDETSEVLINELIPKADIITPNMMEASVLSNIEVIDKASMEKAGDIISKMFDGAVLIKGGNLKNSADDLLIINGDKIWIEAERIDNQNVHGTGCTLSSSLASNLARYEDIEKVVRLSKDYINGAISAGLDLGEGKGPLNHLYKL